MKNTYILEAIKKAGGQQALAERIGYSQAAISKLVRGKSRRPSAEMAVAIDKAFSGEVSKHKLRPDLFGPEPKKQAANQ